MKQMKYKIISEEYHEDFNTFTLKEGKTYFLLGKNGIGKSTLIKYFANKGRDKHYDIEFDVVVPKEVIREYFKDTNLSEEGLETVVTRWKEEPITVSYNTIHNKKYDEFEELKNYVINHITKNNRDLLISELKNLSRVANEISRKLEEEMESYDKGLDEKISIRDITSDYWRKSDKYRSIIYNLREMNKGVKESLKNVDRLINNVSHKQKIDYKDLPGMGNYYFKVPKKWEKQVEKLQKSIEIISSLYRDTSYGNTFYFDDLLYSVLINVGIYVDLNEKWGRFSYDEKEDDKNLSRGESVLYAIKKIANEAKAKRYKTGYSFDEPFNSLDSTNILKARKVLDSIENTKLITTHNTNAILGGDLANVIVMFNYEGKKAIGNYSDLKRLTEEQVDLIPEVSDQINGILNNWFSHYNEKVLLVEGYKDYEILDKALKDIVVIPMGGTHLARASLAYYGPLTKKIKFLFDRDTAGLAASAELRKVNKTGDVSKAVFNDSEFKDFEELITGRSFNHSIVEKSRMFREIQRGDHDEKINSIAKIIKKSFE